MEELTGVVAPTNAQPAFDPIKPIFQKLFPGGSGKQIYSPRAVVQKLGAQAAEVGWMIIESYSGGAKQGAWTYVAPTGEAALAV